MKKLIATIFFLALPFFVYAQSSNSFSGAPANPNKLLPNQFTIEIKPGTSETETLSISNNSDNITTYDLNGVDSIVNEKGDITFRLGSTTQTEVGSWITIADTIEVPAKSTKDINFTVNPPKDALLKDYLGGISIESNNIGTIEKNGKSIPVSIRNVIKLNLKVTDTPQPLEKMPTPPLLTPGQIYLAISVLLFVGVCIFLVVTQLGKKHKNKKSS